MRWAATSAMRLVLQEGQTPRPLQLKPKSVEAISIQRDSQEAKLWLDPVAVAHPGSFRAWELRRIQRIVEEHRAARLEKWNENFGV